MGVVGSMADKEEDILWPNQVSVLVLRMDDRSNVYVPRVCL